MARPKKFMTHTCVHCGNHEAIPRALVFTCPTCLEPPGHPCVDLRPGKKSKIRVTLHRERDLLLAARDIDDATA